MAAAFFILILRGRCGNQGGKSGRGRRSKSWSHGIFLVEGLDSVGSVGRVQEVNYFGSGGVATRWGFAALGKSARRGIPYELSSWLERTGKSAPSRYWRPRLRKNSGWTQNATTGAKETA